MIVADNGSTDGSIAIAESLGARVVSVAQPGYGNALLGGIEPRAGRYVIMGDADDSYDFREVPKFVAQLRQGYDLVQGCRLPSGGGTVLPGAMPWLHRWVGNPLLSLLARRMFQAPIHDIYCGMRGFTRARWSTTSTLQLHRDGIRHGNDHQGQSVSPNGCMKSRLRCGPTAGDPGGRICARFAMAGGRCGSSSSSRRGGCSGTAAGR